MRVLNADFSQVGRDGANPIHPGADHVCVHFPAPDTDFRPKMQIAGRLDESAGKRDLRCLSRAALHALVDDFGKDQRLVQRLRTY